MLQDEVDAEKDLVQRITAIARRIPNPMFADIMWPPLPDVMTLMASPGEFFVSPRRAVAFQRIAGEVRYYAGGWCSDQNRLHLEMDRIDAEGFEMGVFPSVAEALEFTKEYLVDERDFKQIEIPRRPFRP